MILNILICLLTFSLNHVAATGCHDLHQSQINILNERMNQMIDTISTLFPKSLKQLTPPVSTAPTSSVDYTPSTASHEINYYYSPPAHSIPTPPPHIMYIPPPYAPVPPAVAVTSPWHPNLITTEPQAEFPFSTISSVSPQYSMFNYQNEQLPQYANPMPISHSTPPSYAQGPYSLIQSPHSFEYAHPLLYEYPSQIPTYPNVPAYAPGLPIFPLPMQIPPGTYMPAYQQLPELPQKQKL